MSARAVACAVLISVPVSAAQQGQVVATSDGPVTATVQLKATEALVAQPVELRLQVDAPAEYSISLPAIVDALGPFFVSKVTRASGLPVEENPAMRRSILTIQLESLETGDMTVPAMEVQYDLPDSLASSGLLSESKRTLLTRPVSIQILSVLGEGDTPIEFRDLKSAQSPPTVEPPSVPNGAWIASLVIVIAALGFWRRRYRAPNPQQWAQRRIDQIQDQFTQNRVDRTNALFELSNTVREYLQSVLQLPATALSSEELLASDAIANADETAKTRLQSFLQESDQSRFAPRSGDSSQELPIESARQIVRDFMEAR
ncbi:MAG: hypothetical protein AB8B91_19155 [Rubripirellula sp.]